LNHWYVAALILLDVNVTDPPKQNVVGPEGVIVGVAGMGLTIMVASVLSAVEHGPF
jgi:hypothetical protein